MRTIGKQTAWLAFGLVLCHAAVLGFSWLVYPPPAILDTAEPDKTLYQSRVRQAVYGALEHAFTDTRNVLFLGASNVLQAFRPTLVRERFPGYAVQNLGFGSANVTEMATVVEVVNDVLPPSRSADTTFVLGLCYLNFVDNGVYLRRAGGEKGPLDTLHNEMGRWGLYRVEDGDPTPRLSPRGLRTAAWLCRPLLLADRCQNILNERIHVGVMPSCRKLLSEGRPDLAVLFTAPKVRGSLLPQCDTEQGKQANLDLWRWWVACDEGELPDEQFQELDALCRTIGVRGSRVILVDMPLPQWHRDRSPYYPAYRRKLDALLADLQDLPHVTYVDLHDADVPFWDSTHPVPGESGPWVDALCARMDLVERTSSQENTR